MKNFKLNQEDSDINCLLSLNYKVFTKEKYIENKFEYEMKPYFLIFMN